MKSDGLAWHPVRVRDIAITNGLISGPFGSNLGRKDYQASGVPVVRGTNLSNPPFDLTDLVFVSESKADSLARHLAHPGDIVITQRGTLGQVGRIPDGSHDRWVISQSQMALKVDRTVASADFVYMCLRSPAALETIRSRAIVTGVPHINLGIFAELEIPLPPIEEQRRIASILGALDDKVDSNGRLANLLEETAATIFRARFIDFIGVTDLVESEVGPIPRGWSIGCLADIADVSKASTQPADRPEDLFEHFSIPAFDAGGHPEVVRGADILSAKTRLPGAPSLLLSKLNPATKRVWRPRPQGLGQAVCSPEFIVLVPADGTPLCYLDGVLAADTAFYGRLLGYVTGTTGSRQRIKPRDAMGARLVLPPTEERMAYGEAASPLLIHADGLRDESRTLADLRDTLLPKLISGQLRVPDTADPDEVLGPAIETASA